MKNNKISDKKQKQFEEKDASPLEIGEHIYVLQQALISYGKYVASDRVNDTRTVSCTVESIDGDNIKIFEGLPIDRRPHTKSYIIKREQIKRNHTFVGANPFIETEGDTRCVSFCLDSILFNLNVVGDKRSGDELYNINNVPILECNWNPFVYDKDGKKQYYQRDFVWTLENKQLLIESIYQNIDCGKVLIRKRGWNELRKMQENGETELAFNDIVDGKQRLDAIRGFIQGEFPDIHGNYYSDLSYYSQHNLTDHQLFGYAEMPENSKDEHVLIQFLKLNFMGVPQSKEHIEYVKSISSKL